MGDETVVPPVRVGRLSVGGFTQLDLAAGPYAMLLEGGLWAELGRRTHQEITDHREYELTDDEIEALHDLLLETLPQVADFDADRATPDGTVHHFHVSAEEARHLIAGLLDVVSVARNENATLRLVL